MKYASALALGQDRRCSYYVYPSSEGEECKTRKEQECCEGRMIRPKLVPMKGAVSSEQRLSMDAAR